VIRFAALLLLPLTSLATEIPGRVVGVHDGDTVTLLDSTKTQHKIRLQAIDAPELGQAYGQKSKQHLSDLVFGKDVIADCGKKDKYKREICVINVDGKDANLAQVTAGMAWWYRAYAREQTAAQRAAYEAAEDAARSARMGLWQDGAPVAPWEWRKIK
jgi:endonuclease YncB( thermonuclease family)